MDKLKKLKNKIIVCLLLAIIVVALCACTNTGINFATGATVTLEVVAESGVNPVVTSTKGTITNVNNIYKITVTNKSKFNISVSAQGYKTQTVKITADLIKDGSYSAKIDFNQKLGAVVSVRVLTFASAENVLVKYKKVGGEFEGMTRKSGKYSFETPDKQSDYCVEVSAENYQTKILNISAQEIFSGYYEREVPLIKDNKCGIIMQKTYETEYNKVYNDTYEMYKSISTEKSTMFEVDNGIITIQYRNNIQKINTNGKELIDLRNSESVGAAMVVITNYGNQNVRRINNGKNLNALESSEYLSEGLKIYCAVGDTILMEDSAGNGIIAHTVVDEKEIIKQQDFTPVVLPKKAKLFNSFKGEYEQNFSVKTSLDGITKNVETSAGIVEFEPTFEANYTVEKTGTSESASTDYFIKSTKLLEILNYENGDFVFQFVVEEKITVLFKLKNLNGDINENINLNQAEGFAKNLDAYYGKVVGYSNEKYSVGIYFTDSLKITLFEKTNTAVAGGDAIISSKAYVDFEILSKSFDRVNKTITITDRIMYDGLAEIGFNEIASTLAEEELNYGAGEFSIYKIEILNLEEVTHKSTHDLSSQMKGEIKIKFELGATVRIIIRNKNTGSIFYTTLNLTAEAIANINNTKKVNFVYDTTSPSPHI